MDFYKNRFKLTGKIGNNKFSFEDRANKCLVVPSLVKMEYPFNLQEGEVAFCEIEEDIEYSCKGLKNFYKFEINNVPVYIFDNHNHSFFFTVYEQIKNQYENLSMIHVDQHKDMRIPETTFMEYRSFTLEKRMKIINKNTDNFLNSYNYSNQTLDLAYEYGNLYLNVGNYIVPLIDSGYIKEVYIVDSIKSLDGMKNHAKGSYCLNLDLDFFSEDMDYIKFTEKKDKIREIIGDAKFVTISTSPYFVDLSRCITALKGLFV